MNNDRRALTNDIGRQRLQLQHRLHELEKKQRKNHLFFEIVTTTRRLLACRRRCATSASLLRITFSLCIELILYIIASVMIVFFNNSCVAASEHRRTWAERRPGHRFSFFDASRKKWRSTCKRTSSPPLSERERVNTQN